MILFRHLTFGGLETKRLLLSHFEAPCERTPEPDTDELQL